MGNPSEKEKKVDPQTAKSQFPADATTKTMAPPPLALEAGKDAPLQAFGGIFDAVKSGWDWLTGGDKKEEATGEKKAPETAEKSPEKQSVAEPEAQQAVPVSNAEGVYEVTDSKALIRTEGDLTPEDPQRTIPKGEKVTIWQTVEKEGKKYVYVIQEMPEGVVGPPMPYGWTSYGNLTPTSKQDEAKSAEGLEKGEQGTNTDKSTTEGGLTEYELKTQSAQAKGEAWEGSNLTNLMLKKAGFDPPSTWWNNFTSISLLGRQATSLHKDFANVLKNAEAKIIAAINADPQYATWLAENGKTKGDDAKTVGQYLGIKAYSTIRTTEEESSYASMHLFGLAIDFNATENPWISDNGGKQTFDDKGKPKTKTAKLQDFFNRAGSLLGKTLTFEHVNADKFNYDMESTYDNFSKLDKGAEKYFSFLDPANETEMMELVGKSEDPAFKGKTADEVRAIIQGDLDTMSKEWSRGSKSGKESVKQHGIMDLDKRVVMAMGEVGLDWGGKYGDMMHFDMRNTGIGKKIQKAKLDKEVRDLKAEYTKKEKEAK